MYGGNQRAVWIGASILGMLIASYLLDLIAGAGNPDNPDVLNIIAGLLGGFALVVGLTAVFVGAMFLFIRKQ